MSSEGEKQQKFNMEVRSFRNACARRDKMKYSWDLTKNDNEFSSRFIAFLYLSIMNFTFYPVFLKLRTSVWKQNECSCYGFSLIGSKEPMKMSGNININRFLRAACVTSRVMIQCYIRIKIRVRHLL